MSFFSDSDDDQPGKSNQLPALFKRINDGAGGGFVTSIRGLFNSQCRKANAFVLRTMRADPENEAQADGGESDVDFSPFPRKLTMTKEVPHKKAKRTQEQHHKPEDRIHAHLG